MAIFLPQYLKFFREKGYKTDLELAKQQVSSQYKLFTNLGDEIDTDELILRIVGYKEEKINVIDNLKEFKQDTEIFVGEELVDYYLLRDALKNSLNNGFANFIANTSKTIAVSMLTLIISGFFITKTIDILNHGTTTFEILTLIIQCLNFLLFSLTILYMFFSTMSGKNNRARLLSSIVDIIIQEKQKLETNSNS
ncbi:hypothetical protein [Ureibacillus sp. GCM10028918]|uniref:hypothetical protein n=1 Tax=Ureibacillus sp. GCM10028918 TaxID=3273429 RepID=UPI00361ABB4A